MKKRATEGPMRLAPPERRGRVLVVDDQAAMAETIAEGLTARGFAVRVCTRAQAAAQEISRREHEALITDLRLPDGDGLELLALSREVAPESPVIVVTAYSGVDSAVESIRRGAYHYLTKPFKLEELALFLNRALEESGLRREARTLRRALRSSLDNIVSRSAPMQEVVELVTRVAETSVPVLLLGETGTGKSLIARAVHAESPRSGGSFVSVNCASIPENLLESELFGHVKGAFTGAVSDRSGLFEDAHRGTLFLDEIGELPLALQAKLLHVLETGIVRPVGSNREREVDVRIVAATNRNLRRAVRDGGFREDLLYRLDVVSVELPPLRERTDDIPVLVTSFLERAHKTHPRAVVRGVSRDAMALLLGYEWPGNVRELEHLVERLLILGRSEDVTPDDLPKHILARPAVSETLDFGTRILPIRELQRRYAAWALGRLGGAKMATCEALGVDSKTLAKWLRDSDA